MIESIFGKIVSITNNDMVINVGPINLSILIPSSDKYLSLKNGDEIKIRNKVFLSHTYDHRIVDGALGGKFAQKVAYYIENLDIKSLIG